LEDIRVRFAPSPTGTLHIGGARTALFNWLYARSLGGKLILRLEDTDTTRSTEDSARGIIEGLEWLGIDWDEGPSKGGSFGPYRQSERLPLYKQYIQQLLDEGKAYYCFCSPEELKVQREKAEKEKANYKYEGTCKSLTSAQIKELFDQGKQPVVRLKVPKTGITVVHDLIRGDVEFDNSLLDDFIIAKSDCWPTYNFAVVIDDYSMKISHVIRAEEHLSNTPKQLLIYDALNINVPQFAHVSMILAPDRSKLSKRHGATSVQEFRDQGYLPQALINYLVLLGWSPGNDVDIMSIPEKIAGFNLNNVSKTSYINGLTAFTYVKYIS
jgi:glutamyl-tRNA synthetase